MGAPAAPRLQAPPGWETALARNELALLQRHLLRELLAHPAAAVGAVGGALSPQPIHLLEVHCSAAAADGGKCCASCWTTPRLREVLQVGPA